MNISANGVFGVGQQAFWCCLRIAVACTVISSAAAQVPLEFTYQGRLTDENGVPAAGTNEVVFRIYAGGTSTGGGIGVHSETNAIVPDANGVFVHTLGTNSANLIDVGDFASGSGPRFLEIVVSGETNLPRHQLVAVPYAVTANSLVVTPDTNGVFARFSATSATNPPVGDGFRMRFGRFDPVNPAIDILVFEKTDSNDNDPDGSIRFTNTGSDGVEEIAMVIDGSGDVGIGTSEPSERLTVAGDVFVGGELKLDPPKTGQEGNRQADFSLGYELWVDDASSVPGTDHRLWLAGPSDGGMVFGPRGGGSRLGYLWVRSAETQFDGDVCAAGTIVQNSSSCLSDASFKQDVEPLSGALKRIGALKGVSYNWRREEYPEHRFPGGKQLGVIAQQVQQVVPEVVRCSDDDKLSVEYDKLVPLLIEAVKEQQEQIDSLREMLDEQVR